MDAGRIDFSEGADPDTEPAGPVHPGDIPKPYFLYSRNIAFRRAP